MSIVVNFLTDEKGQNVHVARVIGQLGVGSKAKIKCFGGFRSEVVDLYLATFKSFSFSSNSLPPQ